MKKHLLLTATVLILAAPSLAWSQNAPGGNVPGGSGPASAGSMQGHPPGGMPGEPGGPGQGDGKEFQARKAEILQRIGQHLAEIQQRQSCVQAANDRQALMACMPPRGEGHDR